jgi:hypothetical protein
MAATMYLARGLGLGGVGLALSAWVTGSLVHWRCRMRQRWPIVTAARDMHPPHVPWARDPPLTCRRAPIEVGVPQISVGSCWPRG